MRSAVLVGVVALFAAACSKNVGSNNCLAACPPAASISLPMIGVTDDQIRSSTISVCRNAECYTSPLASLGFTDAGSSQVVQFPRSQTNDAPNEPIITVYLTNTAALCPDRALNLNYEPWVDGQGNEGDTFDITLTSNGGDSPWLSVHIPATYQNTNVCGSACSSFKACVDNDAG